MLTVVAPVAKRNQIRRIERPLRCILQMLDVMNLGGLHHLAVSLAQLALVPIPSQDACPAPFPFLRIVKAIVHNT